MVPITNKAASDKQVHCMNKIEPNIPDIGINQQVNDKIATQFGGGADFRANAI